MWICTDPIQYRQAHKYSSHMNANGMVRRGVYSVQVQGTVLVILIVMYLQLLHNILY